MSYSPFWLKCLVVLAAPFLLLLALGAELLDAINRWFNEKEKSYGAVDGDLNENINKNMTANVNIHQRKSRLKFISKRNRVGRQDDFPSRRTANPGPSAYRRR